MLLLSFPMSCSSVTLFYSASFFIILKNNTGFPQMVLSCYSVSFFLFPSNRCEIHKKNTNLRPS